MLLFKTCTKTTLSSTTAYKPLILVPRLKSISSFGMQFKRKEFQWHKSHALSKEKRPFAVKFRTFTMARFIIPMNYQLPTLTHNFVLHAILFAAVSSVPFVAHCFFDASVIWCELFAKRILGELALINQAKVLENKKRKTKIPIRIQFIRTINHTLQSEEFNKIHEKKVLADQKRQSKASNTNAVYYEVELKKGVYQGCWKRSWK